MVQIQFDRTQGQTNRSPSIKAFFNFLNKENYFLKAAGKSKSSSSGDGCIGCSFQAIKTEINSQKHPILMAQTSSTSHTRLSLPYVFFGLGRINNYIEHFNFGVAKDDKFFNAWSPIIPNSQLLLSANNKNPEKWGIEIFINPTQALWLIIASTVCVLILLGIFIVYFHWKEKQEDRKANEHNYSIF
jgi:integrin alpha FG-GAP repeat containing protein 1